MATDNKALVLRHHDEVWSSGNLDAVDEIFAPDFIGHHPGTPDWIGPASVKLAATRTREAFPDFREAVEDVVAEGDKVVTRFTASGTHRGSFETFHLPGSGSRWPRLESSVSRMARSQRNGE